MHILCERVRDNGHIRTRTKERHLIHECTSPEVRCERVMGDRNGKRLHTRMGERVRIRQYVLVLIIIY